RLLQAILDDEPEAVRHEVDRRLERLDARAAEGRLPLARREGHVADVEARRRDEGLREVRAVVALITLAVVVSALLPGVRQVAAVVELVADTVAVEVRLHLVGRTRHRRPIAVLVEVAVVGRRTADRRDRLDPVGRTVVAGGARGPGAMLDRVAEVGRGAADRARRLGRVRRTRRATAGAVLGDVADAARRTAHR